MYFRWWSGGVREVRMLAGWRACARYDTYAHFCNLKEGTKSTQSIANYFGSFSFIRFALSINVGI